MPRWHAANRHSRTREPGPLSDLRLSKSGSLLVPQVSTRIVTRLLAPMEKVSPLVPHCRHQLASCSLLTASPRDMLGAIDAATIIHHHSTLTSLTMSVIHPSLAENEVVYVLGIACQWIATEFDNVTITMLHQESIINLSFQVGTRVGDSTMLNSSTTNSRATPAVFRCSSY